MLKKIGNFFLWLFVSAFMLFAYYMSASLICVYLNVDVVIATVIASIGISLLCFFMLRKVLRCDYYFGSSMSYNSTAFILFVLLWFAGQIAATYIMGLDIETGYEEYSSAMDSNVVFSILLMVVCAPVVEELLFRGVIYSSLKRIMPNFLACLIVSVVFALCHGTLVHIPGCILFSMFQCSLVEKTGNVRKPILFHMMFNIMALVPALSDLVNSMTYAWTAIAGVIIMFVVIVYFYFYSSKNKRSILY